ncbi:MAG: 3'-5' exonuclease [Bacteroidota bacterium]
MLDDLYADHIPKEVIRKLPLLYFDESITVVDSNAELEEKIQALWKEEILGFDTESKPTFRKGQYHPTCLVQLATEKEAFLIRIDKVTDHRPLTDLLEYKGVAKLGISITDDLIDLKKVCPFSPSSFYDLNDLAREAGLKHIGVRKLTALLLKKRISKNQQTSNWENEDLTDAQKRYAATDAWICLQLYKKMNEFGYFI